MASRSGFAAGEEREAREHDVAFGNGELQVPGVELYGVVGCGKGRRDE